MLIFSWSKVKLIELELIETLHFYKTNVFFAIYSVSLSVSLSLSNSHILTMYINLSYHHKLFSYVDELKIWSDENSISWKFD